MLPNLPTTMLGFFVIAVLACILLVIKIARDSKGIEDDDPCPYCGNPIPLHRMERLASLTPQQLVEDAKQKHGEEQPWLFNPMTDEEIEQWYESSRL